MRSFTLRTTGQCELRGHVGNLFQNGTQYVRQMPALVGDTKTLLVLAVPERSGSPAARASWRQLERDWIAADDGGSLALQPGALTGTGYVDLAA